MESEHNVCAGCGRPSWLMICPECEHKSRTGQLNEGGQRLSCSVGCVFIFAILLVVIFIAGNG